MIFKTRHFARWARKTGLVDSLLKAAVLEIQCGLLEADPGGGIVKKRIALPGRGKRGSTRTLLVTNRTWPDKCTDCGCHRKRFFDGGRA
jgi:hypothetical protein